jgi:carboxylate-amine ligase
MQFSKSDDLTFGMELEFQIVSSHTGLLSPSSMGFLDALKHCNDAARFSLEATLSTIELNTSVHSDANEMLAEAIALTKTLTNLAAPMDLLIRGGGTQLTQFWNERVVAPTARAELLTQKFGFLPKRFSTYGMHVHIGVSNADHAIALGNGLQALVPLFIALSAASPFLQMSDTGFCASRPLEPLIYPFGGPMPRLKSWSEFELLAEDMFSTNLATSLKDVYWDVRPKPEFGTIEVRVYDTPISVYKAVALAAFTRACAALILEGKLSLPALPSPPTAERVSRFLACRDGLDADLFDPFNRTWLPARKWFDRLYRYIADSSVAGADLHHITGLHKHCALVQDCQIMRDARLESQAPDRYAPDAQLAHYSQVLSRHLLDPISG